MKYISEKEFLEQPKEVQEVFMKWWLESDNTYDLCKVGTLLSLAKRYEYDNPVLYASVKNSYLTRKSYKHYYKIIPLLTLQQLIEFIEEKTKCNVDIDCGGYGDRIFIFVVSEFWTTNKYEFEGKDRLQALWKVACEVAKRDK